MTDDLYSIAADIAHGPPSCVLKTDDLFCVLDAKGEIARLNHAGLYHDDTRLISSFMLNINGDAPALVDASLASENSALRVRLSCELPQASGSTCTLSIDRTTYLSASALNERIDYRCDSKETVTLSVEQIVAADFSDIFEVRANAGHNKRGDIDVETGKNRLFFGYRGRDGIERCATVVFDPPPASLSPTGATREMSIPPGGTVSTYARISCESGDETFGAAAFSDGLVRARHGRRSTIANAVRIDTDNANFAAWLSRSLADLYMLTTETGAGLYPYAGLPWFSAPFGRDGIITALQSLWADPSIARGVLAFLAETQARDFSREHDAEPGKILHEARKGELANTGEVPFRRYYGSADATPLFVHLAGEYLARTGERHFIADIWPAIERALRWIDRYGDVDGDGFIEYQRSTDRGLRNQGWKDSVDSVFHADGSLADGPIALCEVQAYAYGAKRAAATMATALGENAKALRLSEQATSLQSRFEDQYWSEELNTYVLALDGEKKQCAVSTSNAGHVLLTGVAPRDHARAVADMLCGDSFFSGWGIRTVAASEARYDPLSYHNGSVWPHDTSLIAMGLARYGFTDRIAALFKGMLEASRGFDLQRLPELFSGEQRAGDAPVPFPHACSPQAWSAATPVAFLGAILGIGFEPVEKRVTFRNTRLPPFLDTVTLRGLGIGEATADVVIHADGDGARITVDNVRGDIEFAAIDSPAVRLSVLS